MKILFAAIALMSLLCCSPRAEQSIPNAAVAKTLGANQPTRKAKNVILLIGDGMGLTQISAALYMNGNKLNMERFPVTGLHKNYAANDLVTDSSAGATAFACGVKTYNGAVGLAADSSRAETILEICEKNGLATGLVVTSTIVHATPASFIAHQKHRDMYEAIATDFLQTPVDIFIGGGKKYFDRRKDDRDLIAELKAKGYQISDFFQSDLEKVVVDKGKNFGYFTAEGDPLPYSQGRTYLRYAAQTATDFLNERAKNDKGFFLMVEGSQIDWGGHANQSDYIVSETIEFDQVIGDALDFAQRDGNTLVIVTADHETGGYAINKGSRMDSLATAFTTDYHTATMIPVFAYGPGSEQFSGIYENTAIFDKMKLALGL
jgi:alkaline phosphatase